MIINNESEFFDKDYYEAGPQSGKSLYQNYRWIPELTIPLAHHIVSYLRYEEGDKVLDFGCAKGYLVNALRLLGIDAYGVDVSTYAISQAVNEVQHRVYNIKPLQDFGEYDHIICKDILEHIPYKDIDQQLEIIAKNTNKSVFAIIPLGENGKYIIPAYEADKSHYIRESVEWWQEKFFKVGFDNVLTTTDLGPFKVNWQDVNSKGNLLIVGEKL